MEDFNEMQKAVHKNAVEKGFWEGDFNVAEKLALIHSEVSEALEADRSNNYTARHSDIGGINTIKSIDMFKHSFENEIKDSFEDELADIVIRVMDLAEKKGVMLDEHIKAKHRFNTTRERKHGKKY